MVSTTLTRPIRRTTSAGPAVAAWRARWSSRAEAWRYTARRVAYRGGRVAGRAVAAGWARLAPAWLSITGLASLTAAAWQQAGSAAGLVALGVSAFVLEWRISR